MTTILSLEWREDAPLILVALTPPPALPMGLGLS